VNLLSFPRAATLVIAIASAACKGEPAPTFRETTVWAKVGTWTNTAPLQTESFVSETGSFRLKWTAKVDGETPGHLKVTLHSAVSGRPLATVFEHEGAGGDTAYVSEDPREFFLVIDAERTEWTLEVAEAARAAIRETQR
jgi:hypothetical protein